MTELILSEITRMGPGYCIIGLEPEGAGYRSVRPGPPQGHAWMPPFEYKRGERLQFELSPAPVVKPHTEDRLSTGVLGSNGKVKESELMQMLRRAEIGRSLRELFGCQVKVKPRGAFVIGKLGSRSICGVNAKRTRVFLDGGELRAAVGLPSGESLPDLPVVDRGWTRFVQEALAAIEGANKTQRLNRFLQARLELKEPGAEGHFVRIGLTRPKPNACWLMVDTLFPFPRKSWLQAAREFTGR